MEVGEVPLTSIFRGPLVKFLLSIFIILGSAGLEVLFPKGGMFPSGNISMVPLNWK